MIRRVLITGATGDTGRAATKESINRGLKVRAMVHGEDDRSAALEKQGAEVVVGDLQNIDTIREAMEGIDAAYLVYPVSSTRPSISRRPPRKPASPRSSICPRDRQIAIPEAIPARTPSSPSRSSTGRAWRPLISARRTFSNGSSTRGSFVMGGMNDNVERLTGRKPMSVGEFARAHSSQLNSIQIN